MGVQSSTLVLAACNQALDPEPMRTIVPGQPEDSSGLPPAPATPTRHYIAPLPPAIAPNAPDLFGFGRPFLSAVAMTSVFREERSLNTLFSGLSGIICS